jgi:hypothetical protein
MMSSVRHANRNLRKTIQIATWLMVCFLFGISGAKTFLAAADPFSNFARWYSVTVPDFCEGHNTELVISREFDRDFDATYYVQVDSVSELNDPPMCSNSETIHYRPRSSIIATTSLFEYTGTFCKLKPGRYELRTYRILNDPYRWPENSGTINSNQFTVWPLSHPNCNGE